MDSDIRWIGGDGGPLIVLQAGAAEQWQGASDFNNSLMNGGSVETDYDVICQVSGYFLHRYGRDMLVLEDCSQVGCLLTLPSGAVAVVQPYYVDEEGPSITERIAVDEPSRSLPFVVRDASLRLLVGADSGNGKTYGYVDVPVAAGAKRCDVFEYEDGIALTINAV